MASDKSNKWRERVNEFETQRETGADELWTRLEQRMQANHQQRKRFPFRAIAAAACILFLAILSYFKFDHNQVEQPVVVKKAETVQKQSIPAIPPAINNRSEIVQASVTVSNKKKRKHTPATIPAKLKQDFVPTETASQIEQTEGFTAIAAPVEVPALVSFPALKKKVPVVHVNEVETRKIPSESANNAGKSPKAKWLRRSSDVSMDEPLQSTLSIKLPL